MKIKQDLPIILACVLFVAPFITAWYIFFVIGNPKTQAHLVNQRINTLENILICEYEYFDGKSGERNNYTESYTLTEKVNCET